MRDHAHNVLCVPDDESLVLGSALALSAWLSVLALGAGALCSALALSAWPWRLRLVFILCGKRFYVTVAKTIVLSVQRLYIIYYLPVFYCRAIH